MGDEILKGNFKVKRVVELDEETEKSVREQLKKRALGNLGGSMVYMERTDLTWDGGDA